MLGTRGVVVGDLLIGNEVQEGFHIVDKAVLHLEYPDRLVAIRRSGGRGRRSVEADDDRIAIGKDIVHLRHDWRRETPGQGTRALFNEVLLVALGARDRFGAMDRSDDVGSKELREEVGSPHHFSKAASMMGLFRSSIAARS